MVCGSLRNSIPKSIVYCQVREAKRSLLDYFFADLGKKEVSILRASSVLHFSIQQSYKKKKKKSIVELHYASRVFFLMSKALARLSNSGRPWPWVPL